MASILDLQQEKYASNIKAQNENSTCLSKQLMDLLYAQEQKQKSNKTFLISQCPNKKDFKISIQLPFQSYKKISVQLKLSFRQNYLTFNLYFHWNQILLTIKTRKLILSILGELSSINFLLRDSLIVVDEFNGLLFVKQIIKDNRMNSFSIITLMKYINQRIYKSHITIDKVLFFVLSFSNEMNPFPYIKKQREIQIIRNINMSSSELIVSELNQKVQSIGIQIKSDDVLKFIVRTQLFFKTQQLFTVSDPDADQKVYLKQLVSSEQLHTFLKLPKPKIKDKAQNKQIFNFIHIKNQKEIQQRKYGISGGTADIFFLKIAFIYSQLLLRQKANKDKFYLTKYLSLKKPKLNSPILLKTIQHERDIVKACFKDIYCAFLVKYYISEQESPVKNQLLMDFLPNHNTLFRYNQIHKSTFNLTTKLSILASIVNCIRFLKTINLVHMDLNPNNILIGPDILPKIIDYGQAYCEKVCKEDYHPGFTLPFCPPQVFTQKHFTNEQDIFSFAITTYYLIFGYYPFQVTPKLPLYYSNKQYLKRFYFAPESLNYTGNEKLMLYLFRIILKCFSEDPQRRPHPNWCVIIFKQINFLLKNIFD